MREDKATELLEAIRQNPMRAELKHLDHKVTAQGRRYFTETVAEEIPTQIDWTSKFALTVTRHFDYDDSKRPSRTSLRINSPLLKETLRDILADFPDQSFSTDIVEIDQPYHVLYHYRHELVSAKHILSPESEHASHLSLLLDFINSTFALTIEATENSLAENRIAFEHLWTLFRPGCNVLSCSTGAMRAFKLERYDWSEDELSLQLSMVDFDGIRFGTRRAFRSIAAYLGDVPISALSSMPLNWYPGHAALTTRLIQRGRKFEAYAGMHTAYYKGIGREVSSEHGRFFVDGRVIIDAKTTHRCNGDFSFSVSPFDDTVASSNTPDSDGSDSECGALDFDIPHEEQHQIVRLTDDQCLCASNIVRGFSPSDKKWFDFSIDKISMIDWNLECFDQLVLPSESKDLVRALVASHTARKERDDFDDIVKGKGKGLIFVLHGPPGVGKTLTAETVAEYTKRPLYVISSGELGTDSTHLEKALGRALELATIWKAVLLIDEADVFLERRGLHDLERNALVSIFLRVLEYYQGILFLTSNRISSFDDAFKSRIHVPLQFEPLDIAARKQVWSVFLVKADGQHQLSMGDIEILAKEDLNGRQIKSVIRTAKSLAQFQRRTLDISQLQQVIKIHKDFDKAL